MFLYIVLSGIGVRVLKKRTKNRYSN